MPCSRIVLEHIFNRTVEKDDPQHETAHSQGKDGSRYGNESLWLSWDEGLLDLSRHVHRRREVAVDGELAERRDKNTN
jgi:hypothetical protein